MNYMCIGSVDGSTDAPVKCDHAAETEVFRLCAQTGWGAAVLVAKTEGDPMLFASDIRSHVRSIDRDVPVTAVRTMDDVVEASLGQRRLTMLLAVVGIYGVIAYSVAQRTQELGIRRALGAQESDILRMVVGQGLGLTLA